MPIRFVAMREVVIGIGGNMGDQRSIQAKCIERIGKRLGNVLAVSCGYWNRAEDDEDDSLYLNRCLLLDTEMNPVELLNGLEDIEREFGRNMDEKGQGSQRPLDLDILVFGDRQVSTDELTIPHPRFHSRLFALLPLVEIMPEYVHPSSGKSARDMIQDLS